MANNRDTSVPKFGSFKPEKSAAHPNISRVDNSRGNGKQRELTLGNHRVEKPRSNRTSRVDSYRPSTTHNTQRYRQDRDDRHRDWPAHRDHKSSWNEVRRENPSREEHDCFFVDTRGDLANLQYRRSNKWTVPMYHPYGSGSILGLDPDVKIDRNFSDQNSYTLVYPPKKAPARVIDLMEIDKPLEIAAVDGAGDKCQSAEVDFVPLPFRKMQDDVPSMPVVTPKV